MCRNIHDVAGDTAAELAAGRLPDTYGARAAETSTGAAEPGAHAAEAGSGAAEQAAWAAEQPEKGLTLSAQAADFRTLVTAVCLISSTKASRMKEMVFREQPAIPTPTRSCHEVANDRAHVVGQDKATLARNSGDNRPLESPCFPTLISRSSCLIFLFADLNQAIRF